MKAIILAGGVGSRLWPLSRELYPKQLLRLTGDMSLLQLTVLRAVSLGVTQVMVVASHAHRFYVKEQLAELSLDSSVVITILLEPIGRNTAPAIALAAMSCEPNDVLWVMPADHVLEINNLADRLATAQQLAIEGHLVTFGIAPKHAETGYGYIQQGAQFEGVANTFKVAGFKEKPDLATAAEYLASGEYLWNSGMFCFTSNIYLQELEKFCPEIYEACKQTVASSFIDLGFIKFPEQHFMACQDESIDYAVMEKTASAAVIPLYGNWSDIGSWNSLYELEQKDDQGNVVVGDVLTHGTHNCLIHTHSRLVATVGVSNLAIIETPDALLIADRNQDQAIKQVVAKLKQDRREERVAPRKVYRPWGHYEVLAKDDNFEIRLVTVKPGGKIGEHCHEDSIKQWTVVSGNVDITICDETNSYSDDGSVEIYAKSSHCLVNNGSSLLFMVELVKSNRINVLC